MNTSVGVPLPFFLVVVARMQPTGPARSGRPDDRLRVIRGAAFKLRRRSRISLRCIRATVRGVCITRARRASRERLIARVVTRPLVPTSTSGAAHAN